MDELVTEELTTICYKLKENKRKNIENKMKTYRNIIHQHTDNTIHCFIRFWPLMTIHSSISVPFGFASSALFSFFSIERQSVLADPAKMWDVRRKRVPAVSVDTPPTLFVAELPASL